MDRETTTVPKCQIGFITFLVLPLYTEVRKLLGDDCQVCLDELNRNLASWQSEGDALVADWDLAECDDAVKLQSRGIELQVML